jgi:hypothetical protein
MINSFRMLGKSILQKAGYHDTKDENLKREIYLKNQSKGKMGRNVPLPYILTPKSVNSVLNGTRK